MFVWCCFDGFLDPEELNIFPGWDISDFGVRFMLFSVVLFITPAFPSFAISQ